MLLDQFSHKCNPYTEGVQFRKVKFVHRLLPTEQADALAVTSEEYLANHTSNIGRLCTAKLT